MERGGGGPEPVSPPSRAGGWAAIRGWLGLHGEMTRWHLRFIYGVLFVATMAIIIGHTGIGGRRVWWSVAGLAVGGAFIAEAAHHRLAGMTTALMTGAVGVERRPDPPLSKARYLIQRNQFDDALVELDLVWAAFPGRPEVLACYEQVLVDRMAGPSAFAEFLEAALPRMEAVDKPYAYLRLAELHADRIGDRETGFRWTSRLLAEFPKSPHAAAARALRASLQPKGE